MNSTLQRVPPLCDTATILLITTLTLIKNLGKYVYFLINISIQQGQFWDGISSVSEQLFFTDFKIVIYWGQAKFQNGGGNFKKGEGSLIKGVVR